MDKNIVKRIVDLNREFYQTFAEPFASTRQRLQPGVQTILRTIDPDQSILDLGCGNGELWRALSALGFQGKYLGIDFSQDLLHVATQDKPNHFFAKNTQQAAELLARHPGSGIFLQADLTDSLWEHQIPTKPFDSVFAFAVLHHIPGEHLRMQILNKIHQILRPGGYFWHSEWQFMNSPRLVARIQSWDIISIEPSQIEPGDYLLDWRQGGTGLRYVHHFDPLELDRLAEEANFQICETFLSDGKGNRLALYQKWQALTS